MDSASLGLRELSEPWPSGDRIKAAIARAARLSSLSYWRAFDIWYGKARRVEDYELRQISDALRAKRERAAANELHELKLRLARLEARLSGDPDFHRPDADYVGDLTRQLGGTNSAAPKRR